MAFEKKCKNYSKENYVELAQKATSVFAAFAKIKGEDPAGSEVQKLVLMWKAFITENCYECDDAVLLALSEMYVADSRFKENIDKSGEGTAKFMTEAIQHFCK